MSKIPTLDYDGAVPGPGEQIGPYKLLRILGEGGYGIVYLAEQQRPMKRRVALKVIKPGMDTKQVIARFEAERQALALLDHPNIARVFNAGSTDAGRPYFAMEYVKGVPITEHCDRYKLTIEERLKLFMTVCEAVQYAHQKAIIHRDIKPSNILVAYEGEKAVPMIIDFGVAKALSQSLTERTLVTEQAQMVGTPEYMSPEQAEMTGQDIDTRTDVYSLGALLYELLTGTLPFDPQTLRQAGVEGMRRMIREQEPKTPSVRLSTIEREKSLSLAQQRRTDVRTLGRHLQGELDWITLKAMDKDRTQRYQTAYALAEDIQRYLNQEPVLAGPPSTIHKVRKFAVRNKGLFVSTAAIAGVVILAAVVSFVLAIKATRAEKAETVQRQKAETLALQQEEDLYFNHIKLAQQELNANRPVPALDLLTKCPEHLRNWEWHYLQRKSHFQEAPPLEFDDKVISFDFSPDGSKLAAFCANGKLVIRDRLAGKKTSYTVRENLTQLAYDSRTTYLKWVAFCHDGEHIAVIGDDHAVNLISIVSGKTVRHFSGHTDTVIKIVWSPDDFLLATVSNDKTIRLWNPAKEEPLETLESDLQIENVIFTENGENLIVNYFADLGYTRIFKVQDILSGQKAQGIEKYLGCIPTWMTLSPDGQRMATAMWDSTILLSDGEYNGLTRLEGHVDIVYGVAFNADASRLASISHDLTVRLWDTATGREILSIGGMDPFLHQVAFSKDGHELFVSHGMKTIKIFDASPFEKMQRLEPIVLSGHESLIMSVGYSPSGRQVISCSQDGTARLWNASSGRQESSIHAGPNAQFSADGRWIAATCFQEGCWFVKVWEANPPHQEQFSIEVERETLGLSFSHNSQYLVTGGPKGILYVYDWKSNTKIGRLGRIERPDNPFINYVTASPDGRYLALTGFDGNVTLWDATRLYEPQEGRLAYEGGLSLFRVEFSPDGERLVVGGRNGEILILDAETGKALVPIQDAHGGNVYGVSFSPNGKYLASCSSDQTVRIWNARTGEPVDVLLGHEGRVLSVAFSPDGEHVVSGGIDTEARIWTPELE